MTTRARAIGSAGTMGTRPFIHRPTERSSQTRPRSILRRGMEPCSTATGLQTQFDAGQHGLGTVRGAPNVSPLEDARLRLARAPRVRGPDFPTAAGREPHARIGRRERSARAPAGRLLSVGSERPLQAAEMTKASAGVVEAGARMRGVAIVRTGAGGPLLCRHCSRPPGCQREHECDRASATKPPVPVRRRASPATAGRTAPLDPMPSRRVVVTRRVVTPDAVTPGRLLLRWAAGLTRIRDSSAAGHYRRGAMEPLPDAARWSPGWCLAGPENPQSADLTRSGVALPRPAPTAAPLIRHELGPVGDFALTMCSTRSTCLASDRVASPLLASG
jgi:hypothetical protein